MPNTTQVYILDIQHKSEAVVQQSLYLQKVFKLRNVKIIDANP